MFMSRFFSVLNADFAQVFLNYLKISSSPLVFNLAKLLPNPPL